MASSFKIPKRSAVSSQDGSDCVLMLSPLSRLQDRDPASEKGWGEASAGRKDMMHSGKGFRPRDVRSSFSLPPLFRDTVKSYLGIEQPARGLGGTSTPPHPPSPSHPSRQPATRLPFRLSNGWRPKRASDRLSEELSPLKKSSGSSDCSVDTSDVEPSGPSSSSFWSSRTRTVPPDTTDTGLGVKNHQVMDDSPESSSSDSADPTSDGLLSPPLKRSPRHPPAKPWKARSPPPSAGFSSRSETPRSSAGPAKAARRLSLNRTSWLAASTHLRRQRDEERERERRSSSRSLTSRMRDTTTPSELIVLSSEEEDCEQGEGFRPTRGEQLQVGGSVLSGLGPGPRVGPGSGVKGRAISVDQTISPVMELDFTDLHVGLTRVQPNGTLTISEHCITLPLKGDAAQGGGECEVVVVASQVRGHGLWDGDVAEGGPAPSLLFLWVTDAQAKLLQTELSIIHPVTGPGVSCVFLLVVLGVSELQAALCRSLLDTEQYCTSSSLDLSQAMHLLSSLPAHLHKHLLLLLGQPPVSSNQLIQYPAPPSKGRITVTREDLACLRDGQFLNDVIIDFYLKYLLLEKVDAAFSERCHVFSSFFFKQLSRPCVRGEKAPAILNREMRHQRVKTWTRNVDIFTKDYVFVPVNQEAHWYLLVICFPGLEGVQHQEWSGPAAGHQGSGAANKSKTKPSAFTLRPPECSQAGCERGRVLKRACILVMDSLKLSTHENTCRLLRDYLHVEWQVRRGTSRLFTADTMCSAVCRLPLQDNCSDCGLYLLQYAESFLQNPVVHFDLPVRLEGWFPRHQVRSKRDQIRTLVLDLKEDQNHPAPS